MEMNSRFGDILLEGGLDEAFRALAAESPEWLAVLIETEGRMRHDEDFVRRFEAKEADVGPRIREWFEQQQAAGKFRDDVSWVAIIAVHDRAPQRPRSARRRRRPVRHRRDAAAARRRDRPEAKARAQGQAAGSRSVAARLTSAAPAATDDERDLGAAREAGRRVAARSRSHGHVRPCSRTAWRCCRCRSTTSRSAARAFETVLPRSPGTTQLLPPSTRTSIDPSIPPPTSTFPSDSTSSEVEPELGSNATPAVPKLGSTRPLGVKRTSASSASVPPVEPGRSRRIRPVLLRENGRRRRRDERPRDGREAVIAEGRVEATVRPVAGEHRQLRVVVACDDDLAALNSGRSTFVVERVCGRHLPRGSEGGIERTVRLVARERDRVEVVPVTGAEARSAGDDLAVRLDGDPGELGVCLAKRCLRDPALAERRIERARGRVPGQGKGRREGWPRRSTTPSPRPGCPRPGRMASAAATASQYLCPGSGMTVVVMPPVPKLVSREPFAS